MYKIKEIAEIAGVSSRTLRYYDEIGLLVPSFINSSNYRIYTDNELDVLQQILLFRRMDMPLSEIKKIITGNSFDLNETLLRHKEMLLKQQSNINVLLETIDKTISYQKGETTMSNDQKFEGLKDKLIKENDELYGTELRDKYGEDQINASYQKFKKMSKYQLNKAKSLELEILESLKSIYKTEDSTSDLAIALCKMHERWIKMYWPTYSKEAHMGLIKMYTEDSRFKAYYDKVGDGATNFLYSAMKNYLK